jgi:transglutaminase-like putative cysteine protease
VLFSIATLTSAEIRRAAEAVGRRSGQIARRSTKHLSPRLAGLTALVTFGVLALTSGLFFLLPRTANAALRHLVSKGYFLPGFSNQVTLGQIGEIKTRSTPVMHVRVNGGRLNAKWRGAALSDFDGKKWFNPSDRGDRLPVRKDGWTFLADDTQRRRRGNRVDYRVDVKGIDTTTLFFAGIPEALNLNAASLIRTPQDNYRVGVGSADGVRYVVQSFFEDLAFPAVAAPDLPAATQARYLQLPPLDSRILALARQMSAGKVSVADRARAIEEHLQRDYGYTLELPKTTISDPLAYFLFSRKKGHCEYFASAMAVMLRSLGIPARMVTGFQSGQLNPITELYVIRASDAHSWVEAWLPGRGWTTFDPTPADPNGPSQSWWTTLGFYADAADTFWQEWVVSYDLGQQLALADKMEQSSSRFRIDWLKWTGESVSRWQSQASGVLRQ